MSNYVKNKIRSLFGRKTPDGRKKSIRLGIALGGGGARGLAHIPILELLDEMRIKPCCITGTSIGAVIGALYASGMSGSEIRSLVRKTIIRKNDSPIEILKDIKRFVKFLDIDFMGPGVFKGDSIVKYLYDSIKIDDFDELEIPLKVVTTDFWASSQVVISSGDLLQGVKASMGLPGLFTPVKYKERILIDGGGVNPVPWDVLDECDVIVAVDVLGYAESVSDSPPNAVKAVLDMFDIMQKSIVEARMKSGRPDIYIKAEIKNIGILEFNRAEEIFACAEASLGELKKKLVKYYPEISLSS